MPTEVFFEKKDWSENCTEELNPRNKKYERKM